MKYREIFQSEQVFRGVNTCKNTMNKDDLIVGDGMGRDEDLKKRDKKELKDGLKEEEVSLKMKRKPPKEMMKGGIRDRSLVSWIRILGWFFLFQVCIDSSLFLFLTTCSVVAAVWWAFIIGFLAGCFALMCVFISLNCLMWPFLKLKCLHSGTQSSTALRRAARRPTL